MRNLNRLMLFSSMLLIPCAASTTDLGNHNKRFTHSSQMTKKDWSDPAELDRTWQAAIVRIPKEKGKYDSLVVKDLHKHKISSKKHPTVIYLHGCSGIWRGTYTRLNFFAESGFAAIAPVSFARAKYPQSCDENAHIGGMYRHTLKMRQYDAAYAIEQAKKLDWVDADNIFLAGLSQGGITTATFSSRHVMHSLKARIIEGWTCHAGWQEYRGINAPNSEPVLSLVGEKDPWFQNPWSRGDCGKFMKNKDSKSFVFRDTHLSYQHELLEFKEVQKIVIKFLDSHLH